MVSFRRLLARVVAPWLICEVMALAAAPIALAAAPSVASALPACCRAGAGSHACPMHKSGAAASCTMRATCSTSDAALVSLFGVTGVLPDARTDAIAMTPGRATLTAVVALPFHSDRPDPPPPRA